MPVEGPQYPVNLVVRGRRCLVVGGGHIAARKIEGLLRAEATVHVIATVVSGEVRSMDATWEERPYEPGDVAGYRLVITATDSPDVNQRVFVDGERHGVWVNAADEPASCSSTLPAIARRGPLMVAISTGGHSPALGTWLKRHVVEELGPQYESFLYVLSALREEIKAGGGSTEAFDWQAAFANGVMDRVRPGDVVGAQERLRSLLQIPD